MRALFCLLFFFSNVIRAEASVISCTNLRYGFFSGFHTIVGLLDAYEKKEVAGVEIDLGTLGLYYDEERGPNWWGYYFEPLSIHINRNVPRVPLELRQYGQYSLRASGQLPRKRCFFLINKYIKIRSEIQQEVNEFIHNNFGTQPFVSIHYRGTDKMKHEAELLSVNKTISNIKRALSHMKGCKHLKIFVATDDQGFLYHMKKTFGSRVRYFEMERSRNNQAVHTHGTSSGYIKGKMALLDCLVLSKSCFLFRTSSNLSNAALLFNPSLSSRRLNKGKWGGDR